MGSTATKWRSGYAVAAAVVGLFVLSCRGPSSKKANSKKATAAPATSAQAPQTVPDPTTTASPSSRTAIPAGGSIPAGFQPFSFTAISNSEWWLLGDVACAHKPCTSIVRTNDGGASFVGIPAPPTALLGGISDAQNPDSVSELAFADPMDGFAFRTQLWATHDGGGQWHQVPMSGQVTALAAADGYVLAVVGGDLYRSPAASDSWSRLGVSNLGSESLAVHGSDVVTQTAYVSPSMSSRLLVSHDSGSHFDTYASPDVGLGCAYGEPVAAVIWADCTTGLQSRVLRSGDGGVTFSPLDQGPPFVNFASLAAASSTTAVVAALAGGGGGGLYLTTDGGHTFTPTGPTLAVGAGWEFIGFTDATHGTAIASTAAGNSKTTTSALYRSVDGGHIWSAVTVRP